MRYVALTLVGGLLGACQRNDPGPGTGDSTGATPGMAGMQMPADSGGVSVDRGAASRLGIGFARAAVRPVRQSIRLTGTLAYAPPRRTYISARVNGWVEALEADYVGKPVHVGDALLALYAPELLSAQQEYLAARRLGDSTLMAASRRRLELWNVPPDQIDALERRGTAERQLILRSPADGEIAEKMVVNGQAVRAGDNLFLIADRSVLWVDVAVFEMDARAVRIGTPVRISVNAFPGRTYHGLVTSIAPTVDDRTRTLTARVEVRNEDGSLRPGMYATVEVKPAPAAVLSVPLDAVLPTGTRNLVFVNRGDGRFVPREVITGARGDSLVEIVRGLDVGDEVVASATYLIDSESNLAAAMQGLMLQMGMGPAMGKMPSRQPAPGDSAMREMPGMRMDSGRRP